MSEPNALAYWMGRDRETFVAEAEGAILGTYYMRPNQAGGGKHICNCGYMTAPAAAGRGVATPTLFLGGQLDFNVPLAGGEQMYQALKSLGVPTQLILYPNEHHNPRRPSFVKDINERYLAWYARYLKPETTSDAR